jgi:hypothetical protein
VRARGREAVAGVGRALPASLLGGVAAFLTGSGVVAAAVVLGMTGSGSGPWPNAVLAVAAAGAALAAGALAAALVDRRDMRALLSRVSGKPGVPERQDG